MPSLDHILRQAANPFDPATFKPGNFWQEEQDATQTVASIHQDALATIAATLDQVASDHCTRTLMLSGDSGSGKSHLLGRLKQTLNAKAFFAYIGPWPDGQFIWRHILRQVVDSLIQVPEGQEESQLLLWLKSLSVFQKRSLLDRLLGDRQAFIRKLRETYRSGMYNASEFFSVLYDLLNPQLHLMACDWLRGDDLAEADLQTLGVREAILSEDAAQKILANFGRISTQTQPIVLCFDNLDGLPRSPEGFIDLQGLFSVNSAIHNEKLHNFLVVISIITHTWHENARRVQPADKARIDERVVLKPINLEQAAALWQVRLHPLHHQAKTAPVTPVYPLRPQELEQRFPGGKTYPRAVLELGRRLFLAYKMGEAVTDNPLTALRLIWQQEFQKTQQRITRIRQLAPPELIQMLQSALQTLPQVEDVRPRLLPSQTYAFQSFSYRRSGQSGRIGVIWSEEANMTSFFHIMKACQRTLQVKLCHTLQLIRAEKMGRATTKGYALYQQLFTALPQIHLTPTLESVHYLATYTSLLNAARARDLVVAGKTLSPEELQQLIGQSRILEACPLLQDLGLVTRKAPGKTRKIIRGQEVTYDPNVREFLLSLVRANGLLGRPTLIQQVTHQCPQVNEEQVEALIQHLYQEEKLHIFDPQAGPEEQLIGL